jgi:hypothetical protein
VTGNDLIRAVEATWPIKAQVDGDFLRLWLEAEPEWVAKITAVVTGFVDSAGATRTAYSWRKQQEAAGGQWVDSDDGVRGTATGSPPSWPAFAFPGSSSIVGDLVRIRPGRTDTRSDMTLNYGIEWYFWPTTTGGGNALCTSSTPVGTYYFPAYLMDESAPAPGFPTATRIWLTERNGGVLYAGRKYGFPKYGKELFLNLRTAATSDDRYCCPPTPPFSIPCCPAGIGEIVFSETRFVSAALSGGGACSFVPADWPISGLGPWVSIPADWLAHGKNTSPCSLSGGLSQCGGFLWWVRCSGGGMYVSMRSIPGQNYDGTFTFDPWAADSAFPEYDAGGMRFDLPFFACSPFCIKLTTHWIYNDTINPPCKVILEFVFGDTLPLATSCPDGSGSGGGGTGCYLIPGTSIKVPYTLISTFAVTSGSCSPTPDGQVEPVYFDHDDGATVWFLSPTFTLNGHPAYVLIQLAPHGVTSGPAWVYWDTDGLGNWTNKSGTFILSGGVWTLSVTGIDTGDGCIISLGGTFDTAICA